MDATRNDLLRLCFIISKRNELTKLRHSARFKINYWLKAQKALRYATGEVSNLKLAVRDVAYAERRVKELESALSKDANHQEQLAYASRQLREYQLNLTHQREEVARIAEHCKCAKVWKEMGLRKIRTNIAKYGFIDAQTKYRIMQHTIKTHKTVIKLAKKLNVNVYHKDGYVRHLSRPYDPNAKNSETRYLAESMEQIAAMAREYELNKAIHSMLKEG